jgi:very-short-patch-repair endonuclease
VLPLPEVVAAQDGLLTRSQALAAGLSDAALRHAIRPGGPWQRLAPGLYATFTGPLGPRQRVRAALLHAGSDAVLSGPYACRAHGLRYVPTLEPPLVLVPPSVRARSNGLAQVHRTTRPAVPREVAGVRVAPVERAVLDTAALTPSLQDVRALVCESVQRRLTVAERLADVLDAAPRRGSRLARRAIADVLAGCRSAPECELRDLLRMSRLLPEARWNTPLPDLPGVVPDAWFEAARLALEVDSVEHHAYGLAPEHTQRRQARITAAGWTVLPIGPRRIRREPQVLLVEVEAAYRAGLAR